MLDLIRQYGGVALELIIGIICVGVLVGGVWAGTSASSVFGLAASDAIYEDSEDGTDYTTGNTGISTDSFSDQGDTDAVASTSQVACEISLKTQQIVKGEKTTLNDIFSVTLNGEDVTTDDNDDTEYKIISVKNDTGDIDCLTTLATTNDGVQIYKDSEGSIASSGTKAYIAELSTESGYNSASTITFYKTGTYQIKILAYGQNCVTRKTLTVYVANN